MSHYLAAILAILLTPAGQIVLKSGVNEGTTLTSSFLNFRTLLGLAIFFLSSLLAVYALQLLPLKTLLAWASSSYVIVAILTKFVLNETVSPRRLLGCCFVTLGVVVFSL